VIGDEKGDATVGEAADLGLEIFDGDWVYATEGFIEEDEARFGDQCASDFELSAFATGASAGLVFGFVGEAELFEEGAGAGLAIASRERAGFEDGEKIVLAGEAAKDAGFL